MRGMPYREPGEAAPHRLVEVRAAVEPALQEVQQVADGAQVLVQLHLPHFLRAGKTERIAPPLLHSMKHFTPPANAL